jgi:hypothetical protein
MPEIQIHIDRGHGEKLLLISSEPITMNTQLENNLYTLHKPELIVFGLSGESMPPFLKGSRILRELRETSGYGFDTWKQVLKIDESDDSFFNVCDVNGNDAIQEFRPFWGVWICKSVNSEVIPDLIAINYPFWMLKNSSALADLKQFEEKISTLYRCLLAGIDAAKSFQLKKTGVILMSDLGGNMVNIKDPEKLQKFRVKILCETIGAWLGNSIDPDKVVVSYGAALNHNIIGDAWDEQAEENINNQAEFGESLLLRQKNSDLCKRISSIENVIKHHEKITHILSESAEHFKSDRFTLAADLIQCRSLAEALAAELLVMFKLKSDSANLIAYVLRLEESKKISPWITSYFHILRLLGNEAAHYKLDYVRRPEKPVGKDLIVIHGALNRILSFCISEFENR